MMEKEWPTRSSAPVLDPLLRDGLSPKRTAAGFRLSDGSRSAFQIPGVCPRCGMKLVAGLPTPVEYPMEFRADPPSIPAGREIALLFRVLDPATGRPVTHFEIVHEKLFHLFLVSQDLEYFSHEHPIAAADGWFRLKTRLPKPGTYRLLADFDPTGGTPQLAATHFRPPAGTAPAVESHRPSRCVTSNPSRARNLEVSLTLDPELPIAGKKTMLFFHVRRPRAWSNTSARGRHLLAVSNDLIDTIHSHPFLADGGSEHAIQSLLSPAGHLPGMGPVAAPGCGEYGGLHLRCAHSGVSGLPDPDGGAHNRHPGPLGQVKRSAKLVGAIPFGAEVAHPERALDRSIR